MNIIVSVIYWIYFFLVSALFCFFAAVSCLLTAPFDVNRRFVHKVASLWGYQYLWLNPLWRCRFGGVEHINPLRTYILVANHQSFWDIMVLYGLNRHFKWVAKDSVLKIPFIGWNMLLNQYVVVSKSNRRSIKAMFDACHKWLGHGSSIMIFPEGTRSLNGELGEFRDGPFKLAFESGFEIVPVVLDGTVNIMKKGSIALNFSSDIEVQVLPPTDPREFESVKELRDCIRKQMNSALMEMRSHSNSQRRGEVALHR